MRKLEEFIVVLDGVFTPNLCDAIIAEYGDGDDWVQTEIRSGVDTSIRSAMTIGMSHQGVMEKNYAVRRKLDAYAFASVSKAIQTYNARFPYCLVESDSGYDILRYEPGQFYKEHVDSCKQNPRSVSCSIALNDDYDGGEFAFFGGEIKKKLPKGSALLFPSTFMYPHEILPVTRGTRYSIITWFI